MLAETLIALAVLAGCAFGYISTRRCKSNQLPVHLAVPLPENLESRLRQLMDTQGKISAIKYLREQTGLGLKEAKAIIDSMSNGQTLQELIPNYPADPKTSAGNIPEPAAGSHSDSNDAIRNLLLAGKKIEAIKLHRDNTGLGLRAAKEAVERMEKELGIGT